MQGSLLMYELWRNVSSIPRWRERKTWDFWRRRRGREGGSNWITNFPASLFACRRYARKVKGKKEIYGLSHKWHRFSNTLLSNFYCGHGNWEERPALAPNQSFVRETNIYNSVKGCNILDIRLIYNHRTKSLRNPKLEITHIKNSFSCTPYANIIYAISSKL